MKKSLVLSLALAAMLWMVQPVFADEYQDLVGTIQSKMQTAELADAAKQDVAQMLQEGKTLFDQGDHEGAIAILKEALSLLEN